MAWTTPRTWSTGEVVTAALLNAQIKGNMDLSAPAIMTTAGDIIYASGANTPARLAKDTNATRYLANTGTSNVPAWNQVNVANGVTGTLPVGNGGTGATTLTDGGVLIGNGTGAMVAMAVLADGEMIVGDGTTDPVAESGATLRTSIGVGTGDSPQFTDLTLTGGCITITGAATDIDLIDNNACALSFDASGQAGILAIDTQNCAEGVKMNGTLTVGVDDTGHDVKFFGAAAGAFMIYDQSCNLLEVRGATAAGPGHLKLTTGEATVVACDVLGKIEFQAPAECGTDAIVAGANIQAVAQATFSATVNNTDLLFMTGLSGAATEKFRFTANGELGVGGANYGTDGQVLTSTGAGTAPAWEDAGGGVVSGGTDNAILRADGTGGSTSQGSAVTIADTTGSMTFPAAARLFVGDGNAANPSYGFIDDGNAGMTLAVDTVEEIALVHDGVFSIRANGHNVFIGNETANGNITRGLTINQQCLDNEIFALKSSDVAHNTDSQTEPDTYAMFKKSYATAGGLNIYGLTDGNAAQATGIILTPILGIAPSTAHTAAGVGILSVNAGQKAASGCGVANPAGGANLFAIRDLVSGNAKMLVDQEGDLFLDATLNASHYDTFCDAQLTRALSTAMDNATKDYDMDGNLIPQSDREPSQIIRNKWDEFTTYNEQSLIDAGILGGPVVGVDLHNRGLVNVSQLQRLHNGAIWQLHSKLNDQAEDITALKGQLQALQEGK
jgi:hypothetical protein